MAKFKRKYDLTIIVLALISVSLVVLDILSFININHQPFAVIDFLILLIFTVDYIGRLYLSKRKLVFIKSNFFDLLAIIPFHSAFAVFRLTRLLRITRLSRLSRLSRTTRLFRLTRVIGVIGKASRNIKSFFQTNGFIYMMYIAGVILLIGAATYSFAENVNFIDSLWWAFVTSTTVGYGDISPTTNIGRLAAMILMLTGIGIFGALTSTITSFFMNDNKEEIEEQNKEISELNNKITLLLVKLDHQEVDAD